MVHNFLAQAPTTIPGSKPLGTFEGLGPLGSFLGSNPLLYLSNTLETFTKILSVTIGVMTIVAFIWFLFTMFIGAISWLSSGGDKAKLQEAQKKISTGVIGLVIVISAMFLIKIIGTIFGIDILNIYQLILGIWP